MTVSRRARLVLSITAGVLIALIAIAAIIAVRFQPTARSYVITTLERRYASQVELGDFRISLFPVVRATGENLVLRWNGRRDLPPLVVIRKFSIESPFVSFFRTPRHIHKVTFEGLEIHFPPKDERPHAGQGNDSGKVPFVLEEVIADGATLETLPADPTKSSLKFLIHQLRLRSVGRPGQPMSFHAELENPKPRGLIHSDGEFGPWQPDDPGATAVAGRYTFNDADLGVFHGISGRLSSSGTYRGSLDRIEVQGTTDTPDFALTTTGRPMHLETAFNATVDGTNGDTILHPVSATLGKSKFEVTGAIERSALETHKEIDLDAKAANTGVEDFLRLAMKSGSPTMTGRIAFQSKVKIPPGETAVVERLQLDGAFTLNGVRFTSPDVQEKIASLSHHAQGQPKDKDTTDVRADFEGYFHLRAGTLRLPQLHFEVPGADVSLDGQYVIPSGAIDFTGAAKLDATVSQMTTGWKHVLLRPFDPLFKRDGAGTYLPIKISGTRGSPSFKLDIGKIFKR